MDDIKVDVARTEAPDWARTMAPPGAPGGMSGEKIRPKQREFLLALIEERQIDEERNAGKLDLIMKCLRISEDPEEYGMSKTKASELITWFLTKPKKPQPAKWASNPDVPAGRYAVENVEGELRFYQVWRPKDNQSVFRLYVLHGPDSSLVPFSAQRSIMDKIGADIRKAAIRFGMEIGSCSNCGRRLTNTISRELGIGPVCGGRLFGDTFKAEVKSKRAEIIARGDDPDAEVA